MHQYTPNPTNNPATVTELDDSDPPNASTFNTPTEVLADKIAWTQARRRALAIAAAPIAAPTQVINGVSAITDVTGASVSITGTTAGDIVEADAVIPYLLSIMSDPSFYLTIIDGASTTDLYVGRLGPNSGTAAIPGAFTLIGVYTVVTGGTLTLKLRAKENASGQSITLIEPLIIRYRLNRGS
ncbi:MAG TPA: hypothetical protein VF765_31055 [Polyangiaceae bacterium]